MKIFLLKIISERSLFIFLPLLLNFFFIYHRFPTFTYYIFPFLFLISQALTLIPHHSRPLGHQVNNHHHSHHHHKHHHRKKPGTSGVDGRDGKGHRHKHRSNNHHKRTSTSKLTENEGGFDPNDSSLNIPLSEMTPSPSSSAIEDIDEDEEDDDQAGIVMHFSGKNASGRSSTVPSLPSADYAADSPKLSRYNDSGQRDHLAALEAKKWRSYTLVSDDGVEVIANKEAVDVVANKDAVVVDVPDIQVTSDDDDNTEQGNGGVGNGETTF